LFRVPPRGQRGLRRPPSNLSLRSRLRYNNGVLTPSRPTVTVKSDGAYALNNNNNAAQDSGPVWDEAEPVDAAFDGLLATSYEAYWRTRVGSPQVTVATSGCTDPSTWDDAALVCGECAVLVNHFRTYGTCSEYCSNLEGGGKCRGAWEEGEDSGGASTCGTE
jgi:hypothetical protein